MPPTSPRSGSDWEPPLPEDLQAMLPQYEITAILGRGGMGAVYRGRQAKLDRAVAIKLLPETFSRGEDQLNFAARFLQEAQAMGRLDHPAIISVYDFGETPEGQLYFVMEFVDGMDIHQYLQAHGGRLDPETALAITSHVLDALDYAHAHGIMHRDIKPANILLNREGRVKIADFGLAKRFGEAADESAPALTMSNVAVGTPDYVAPEALDNERTVDHRADLYAVGVMLYQMLTGRLPRGQFKLPSEVDVGIDVRFDDIVDKAMQSDPDDRYKSAAEIRADLDAITSQPINRIVPGESSGNVNAAVPVTTSVRGQPTRKETSGSGRGAAVAVPIVLVVAIVAWGVFFQKEDPPAPIAPVSVGKIAEPTRLSAPPVAEPTQGEKPKAAPEPGRKPEPAPLPVKSAPLVGNAPPDSTTVPPSAPQIPAVVASQKNPATLPAAAVSVAAPPGSKAEPAAAPAHPLAGIPGLEKRIGAYLDERDRRFLDLSEKYGKGLDGRIDQAANRGDLNLVQLFRAESDRLNGLKLRLAEAAKLDPLRRREVVVTLENLPDSSPESLVSLRGIWSSERGRIDQELGDKLNLSLGILVTELTRNRAFDQAGKVESLRTSLILREPDAKPATAKVPPATTPSPELARESISLRDLPRGSVHAFEIAQGGTPPAVDKRGRLLEMGEHRDYVRVDRTPHWPHALRANGEFVGYISPPKDSNRNIIAFSLGYTPPLFLHQDGTVSVAQQNLGDLPPGLDLSAIADAVSVASCNSAAVILRGNGEMIAWRTEKEKRVLFPVEKREKRVLELHCTADIVFGRLEGGGFQTIYPPEKQEVVNRLNGLDTVVSLAATPHSFHVLAVDGQGKVHAAGSGSAGATDIPPDLGPVRQVRVGEGISIAQLADGKWRAWGSERVAAELLAKIATFDEDVIDVSVVVNSNGNRSVIWIEK